MSILVPSISIPSTNILHQQAKRQPKQHPEDWPSLQESVEAAALVSHGAVCGCWAAMPEEQGADLTSLWSNIIVHLMGMKEDVRVKLKIAKRNMYDDTRMLNKRLKKL